MKTNLKLEAILGALATKGNFPSEVKKVYDDYNNGKLDWKKFGEELERLMWKSKTNSPQYFASLKAAVDKWKERNVGGGIKLKDEGFGWGDPKKKDPKKAFKSAHWTVKFDEAAGEREGRTPHSTPELKKLVMSLAPNLAISFYGLTLGKGVSIRKTEAGHYEIFDDVGNNEYQLQMPRDRSKLDLVISQIAANQRRFSLYKIFKTVGMSVAEGNIMKKSELKEIIKELINEMWIGWEEDKKVNEGRMPEDPTKEEMVKYLKQQFGSEADEFSVEEAIYWFSNFNHGGQWSNLYSVLSTSPFKPGPIAKGPEKEGMGEVMYNALEDEFGGGELKEGNKEQPITINIIDKVKKKQEVKELYEAKGKTSKDKLRNMVREVINEVEFETDSDWEEKQELGLMKQIQSAAYWLENRMKYNDLVGQDVHRAIKLIKNRIDELINTHEKRERQTAQRALKTQLQYKRGLPIPGIRESKKK